MAEIAYFFRVSRTAVHSANVKITTSSAVVVLMSWCKLTTFTPVISWTIASMTGRAVSIRCVRTCLSRSRAFFGRQGLHQLLLGRGQDPLQANHQAIAKQVCMNRFRASAHVRLARID